LKSNQTIRVELFLATVLLVLTGTTSSSQALLRMIDAEEIRIRLIVRRTMLAVRKSMERLQQTNELLERLQAVQPQVRIKPPDQSYRPERTDRN